MFANNLLFSNIPIHVEKCIFSVLKLCTLVKQKIVNCIERIKHIIPTSFFSPKFFIAFQAIVCLLFILLTYLHAEYSQDLYYMLNNRFYKFNIKDNDLLTNTFIHGTPSLFYCVNSKLKLNYNIYSLAKQLPNWLKLYYLNCYDKLPSGKTIYRRFNLPDDTVLFANTRGKPPSAVPVEMLDDFNNVKKYILKFAKYQIKYINKPEDYNSICKPGKADRCIVFFASNRYINIYQSKIHDYICEYYAKYNLYKLIPFIADSDKFNMDFGNDTFLNKYGVGIEAICVNYLSLQDKPKSLVRHLSDVYNIKHMKKFTAHCLSGTSIVLDFSEHMLFNYSPKIVKINK